MDIDKIKFIGKLENIKNVEEDFKNFPKKIFNCNEIEARVSPKEIYISPSNNEELKKIIIPKGASKIQINYEENKTQFKYNERTYYVFKNK